MKRYGIGVGPIWRDTDLIEVPVWGQSKYFGGSTSAYESLDVFKRLADTIKGFPASAHDTRTFQIGYLEPGHELGGAELSFYCVDNRGHAAVRLRIVKREPVLQTADFVLPIVAASVDVFVNELLQLHEGLVGTAFLEMYME